VNMHFSWRGSGARPAKDLKVRSSLVRRLVQAQDDPAKHRIRAWLCDLNDEQLSSLGCTFEDIAVLRGTQSPNSKRRKPAPSKQLPSGTPFPQSPTTVSRPGRRRGGK
jgi:hypothetical protein